MKKLYLSFACLAIISISNAQYCTPVAMAYNADMPGITQFVLNTIDRESNDLESMTNNYVNTEMSTDLQRGQTYDVSFSFTIDASICPDMNLRVWIDYNQDFVFDTLTETAMSANHKSPNTYVGTLTVPMDADLGQTRLRATAKMSSLGGHIAPSPCDNPQDPLGYHGEIEDYNVNITAATNINSYQVVSTNFDVYPNPATDNIHINYNLSETSPINLSVYNMLGQKVTTLINNETQTKGEHSINQALNDLVDGAYVVELSTKDFSRIRFIVKRSEN